MNRTLRRSGALAAPLAVAATMALPMAAQARPTPLSAQLAEVRAATTSYHDVDAAIADGFTPTVHCVDSEDGAMGYHYVNLARVFDGAIVPTEPEVLLYAPQSDGTPRLVGIEYLSLTPTSLFRQEFEPGPGGTVALHAWIWQANPAGMFAGFNPNVSC
jgi:hypothetical protein